MPGILPRVTATAQSGPKEKHSEQSLVLLKVKRTGSDSIPRPGGSQLRKARLISDPEPEWEKVKVVERNQEEEEATTKEEATKMKEATKIKEETKIKVATKIKEVADHQEVADLQEVETEEEVAEEVDDQ